MATEPSHRNEQTGQPGLDRVQANVRDLVEVVKQLSVVRLVPFLFSGKHIKGIVFAAGVAKTVRHGLGHRFNGYIITRSYGTNVGIRFGESGAAAADPLNDIVLITTLASTFDVWFY